MSRPIFLSYAGIDQLLIATVEDLERLDTLDKARWAATSVPCEQLFADPVLLAAMDTDRNNRIRIDELKAARRWLWERLRVRDRVVEGSDTVMLDHVEPDHAEARRIVALAHRLLHELHAPATDRITLDQVRRFKSAYMARMPNGDGVVTPGQIPEPELAALASAVLGTTGGALDLSGSPGVRAEDIDLYVRRVADYAAWRARGQADEKILAPLGPDTPTAVALIEGLAPKVAQFFAQCALVALESNAAERLRATPDELAKLDVSDPVEINRWLASAPLARPNAEGKLPLRGATNPHFAAALHMLSADVGPRALGRAAPLDHLCASEWAELVAVFLPGKEYLAERPTGIPADADPAALSASAASPAVERLRELVAEDLRVAAELQEFNDLEYLVLLHRWLLNIANNMVSFPDLFAPTRRALFEAGTLVLDGRRINLCMKVFDRVEHRKLAEGSLMFVAYVDLVRKEGDSERKASIAAAVTAGVRGGIAVGKRGVFYDREDGEWDAMVTDLIVQPISLLEAVIAPFVRVRDLIAARFAKLAEEQAASLEGKAGEAALGKDKDKDKGDKGKEEKSGDHHKSESSGNLQNLLVSASVAFAALSSSMAFVVKTVSTINPLGALAAVAVLALAIVGIFGLLGWLRLRRRDLSALLEACGWALNGRMRLTHPLAMVFTVKPGLPDGAVLKVQVTTGRVLGLLWLLVFLGILVGLTWLVVANPQWFQTPRVEPVPEATEVHEP